MKTFWKLLQVLLAVFLIYGGIQHFVKPAFYEPFVPGFLVYKTVVIYISGILEIALGILLFIPKYAKLAATGIIVLMLAFLPVHVWDVLSDSPAIGSHRAALIRLPVQLLFIGWAYKVKQFVSK